MDLTGNPSGCGLDDAKRMKYMDTYEIHGYIKMKLTEYDDRYEQDLRCITI